MFSKHPMFLHLKSVIVSPLQYVYSWRSFFAYGTQKHRWANLQNHDAVWDERTVLVASMIDKGSSVLEFGAGRERLKDFLPANCTYQPSDIVERSENTIVCDLNNRFPELPQKYDVIVLSGVMEYIAEPYPLLENIRNYCRECVVSHASMDQLECMSTRVGQGWISHLSQSQFQDIIKKAGFGVIEQKAWRNHIIYRLK